MSLQRSITPFDAYHINLVNMNDIDRNISDNKEDLDYIKNLCWYPISHITNILVNYCIYHTFNNILEIGPGTIPFKLATTFIGYDEDVKFQGSPKDYIHLDIDIQPLPFTNNYFNFTLLRHVIEDIQNPDFALKEIIRTSNSFYIETPSPLVEICKGIDGSDNYHEFCGYIHHRYIVWTNMEKNTIYILPKYGLIENLLKIKSRLKQKIHYILNNFPVYWNTYFLYNKNMEGDVNIVMYKHGINMDIFKDYARLIEEGIHTSIESTNYFINNYKKYLE